MKRKRSNKKIIVCCAVCGKEKIITPCRYKEGKKFFCSPEHQKKAQKGRTLSEETKKRISETKGGIATEIRICKGCGIKFEVPKWSKKIYHDRQCSSTAIGQLPTKPWNKGLTKDTDKRLQQNAERHSKYMKEQYDSGKLKVWNKGLTAKTDERMKKLNDHLTKMRNTEGPWKEAWKEAMRKGQVHAWANGSYDRAITKPEQITWDYLEFIGYSVKHYQYRNDEDDLDNTWYFQFPFMNAFVPDFALPKKQWIIEVNGCAVHGHNLDKCTGRYVKYGLNQFALDNAKRDRRKYSMYYRNGWKWALVWQCEADNGDFHRLKEYLK